MKNAILRREVVWLGWKEWLKLIVRGLLGCGDFDKLLRTIRTIRFVRGMGAEQGDVLASRGVCLEGIKGIFFVNDVNQALLSIERGEAIAFDGD